VAGGPVEQRIAIMIEPALEDMGYALVRVRLSGGERLQIMAERADESGMTVDDCARISRALSALLDAEDPIDHAYALEVSSPGLDRPLVRAADFTRFAGAEAKVVMRAPIDGRRRFRGRIIGLSGDCARLALAEGGAATLPVAEIESARLMVSDACMDDADGTRGRRVRDEESKNRDTLPAGQ